MNLEEFNKEMSQKLSKIDIELNEQELNKFYQYMKMIIEWNEKINLTAITEPNEIIQKHFIDSLTIQKYIKDEESIIDVGTGAGFPGIPLNIMKSDCKYILLDSLNKRIKFLDEVIENTHLKNIKTIHGRVEEIGKNKEYREKYDIATSRAVAPLNILIEYLLPLVKIGGKCICMKGSNIEEELKNAEKAIKELGGEINKIENIYLPDSDIQRNIIIIKKIKNTPSKYPRKPGIPSKQPL